MLLFNVLLCQMRKPEGLPHITHLAKHPLSACDQERYLEARKDSHVSMCIWFSSLYVHLVCLHTFCFLKWPHLHVTFSCCLAGEPMQPLWQAVIHSRDNAEVLGYCGGSPRTQLHFSFGVPFSAKTSPLVGNSGWTTKAEWQLLPKLESNQQFAGKAFCSEQSDSKFQEELSVTPSH